MKSFNFGGDREDIGPFVSEWNHDINQNCVFYVSNISQGNVDIQKSATTHTRPFSQKILSSCSTVDSILTKIMVYFEDKTNRKKKTAALLLYTQLEPDKIILKEQHHLLQVFGLFIIMLSFKQHSVFFLVEQYPLQFSTNESFIYIEQFCVSFMRKID